ncbi:MAG: archaeosortase A [Halobacteriales archaeon]
MPTAVTDIVAWIVIGLFLTGWALQGKGRYARSVTAVAWGIFGGFWLLLIPRFALVMKSPIETVLSILAVPVCVYVGYLVWSGRESLFVLSRAVAIMGVVYLPFETIPLLRRTFIETVARQTLVVIGLLGSEATLTTGPEYGYQSALVFTTDGHRYVTHIVLACTGVGSMSIFAGLIAALDAPLTRKLRAASVAIAVIYVLNLLRNAFIAVAFGEQWFQILIGPVMAITGYQDPGLVSFFIADRVISQSASVLALVGITWLVVRYLPELLTVIEDLLFIVTREEYDLRDRMGKAS